MLHDSTKIAAVKYCEYDYKVFLLSPGTKIPFKDSNGVDDATNDVALIENNLNQNPDANLAIAVTNVLVIDTDEKKGKNGSADLAEIEKVLGKLSDCPKVQTTTGGYHRYFKKPDEKIVGTNGLKWNGRKTGIDIQTNNQYVVAPPSTVDGKSYQWITPIVPRAELPELPKAWVEYLSNPSKPKTLATPTPVTKNFGNRKDLIERCREHVATMPPAIDGQHGHDTTFHVACVIFKEFGLTESEGYPILYDYNQTLQSRWTDPELRHKMQDALAKAAQYPAEVGRLANSRGASGYNGREIEPVIQSFDEITEEDVAWLLQDIFPMGMVSMLAGKPGDGKSFETCWMAAGVSGDQPTYFRGKPIPQGVAIICNAEDSASVIKKRLRLNGANLLRIKMIPHVHAPARGSGGKSVIIERPITLEMIDAFRKAFEKNPDCRLLIIDPVSAFWGDRNDHNNSDVRVVLAQLKKLAEEFNVAVVLVSHLNKMESADASARITGSMGLLGAVRSGWLLSQDETGLRTVSRIKSNVSESKTGFTFGIEHGRVEIVDYEIDVSADDVLATEIEVRAAKKGRKAEAMGKAVDWLCEFLKDGRKPAGSERRSVSGSVHFESNDAGHAWRTIRRAADSLKVTKVDVGGTSFWELPNNPKPLVQNASPLYPQNFGQVNNPINTGGSETTCPLVQNVPSTNPVDCGQVAESENMGLSYYLSKMREASLDFGQPDIFGQVNDAVKTGISDTTCPLVQIVGVQGDNGQVVESDMPLDATLPSPTVDQVSVLTTDSDDGECRATEMIVDERDENSEQSAISDEEDSPPSIPLPNDGQEMSHVQIPLFG